MEMSRDILRRCRVVIVCSNDITENMEKDILLAKRIGIVTTTLAGILDVKRQGQEHDA